MGIAKWGMLTAGRNKKQVHEKVKKMKSQGPEARPAGVVRGGSRKTEECHGHQQVCWLRIMRGLPVGLDGRGGNGVYSRQAKGGGGKILLERAALSGSGMEEDFVADGRAAFCVLKLAGKESAGGFLCCSVHTARREMWNGENAALYLQNFSQCLATAASLQSTWGHERGLQGQIQLTCKDSNPSSIPGLGRLNRILPEQHRLELTLNFHVLSHQPELNFRLHLWRKGLRAAQPGLLCALQCCSPCGLGFVWFLELSCSARALQGSRSTA